MNRHSHKKQRGAALIIGLILLAVITLLAVVGMNVSNSELASATSEQQRLRAFQAAEIGIEYGLERVFDVSTSNPNDVDLGTQTVTGSAINTATSAATDSYSLTGRYRGGSKLTDGFGRNFYSFHFTVVSQGNSGRNARANHVQGAYVVNGTGGQDAYGPLNEADPDLE